MASTGTHQGFEARPTPASRPLLLLCLLGAVLALIAFRGDGLFEGSTDDPLLLPAALASLVLSLLLSAICFLQERRLGRWGARLQRLQTEHTDRDERERRQRRTIRHLRRQLEFLSAIREVALIANDDVDFRTILGDVLRVIGDLVSAEEVIIYRKNEDELRPEVRRYGNRVSFDDIEADTALARTALDDRRTMRRFDRHALDLATLLLADGDILGVLRARIPIEGLSASEIEETEQALETLSKHIALAMEKPTLYDRAVVDGLTRLYTKRHFVSQLKGLFGKSKRMGEPLSLIMVDIDHFKSINDTYGHLTGDIVLREVADILKSSIREYDTAYRYGGEEMAILAPGCTAEDAKRLAERIRVRIGERTYEGEEGEELNVTASFGVAGYEATMAEPDNLVGRADQALYASKTSGRNRVTVAPTEKEQRGEAA